MAIRVVTDFHEAASVRVRSYIYDDNDALADPTSVTIDITDPDGTLQVDGVAMSQITTGIYEYYYHKDVDADPMDAGMWRGLVKAIDGSGASAIISPSAFGFRVK